MWCYCILRENTTIKDECTIIGLDEMGWMDGLWVTLGVFCRTAPNIAASVSSVVIAIAT